MADNVGYTPGAGVNIAADEVPAGSGVLVQRIKPTFGPDGTALDVSSATPMPIVDEQVPLLRRITKLLETLAVVDSARRQRVSLDTIPAGVTLPTVTTVSTVTAVTTVGAQTSLAGMDREMYINISRQTFANCIRNRLT